MARTKAAPKPAIETVEEPSSFVLDDEIDVAEAPAPVEAAPPLTSKVVKAKPEPIPVEPEPEPLASAPKVRKCCANCAGWRKSAMYVHVGQCLPSGIGLPAPLTTTDLTSCQRFELRV